MQLKLLFNYLQVYFMTFHVVVTLKLKSDKKSDKQLRRSGTGSYTTVTLIRLQLYLDLSASSSSGKNGLLRGSGSNTLVGSHDIWHF